MRIFAQLVLFLVLFTYIDISHAQTTDEATIKEFMFKIQSVMNKRNLNELDTFLTYYTDSSARFVKTSYLLDPRNTSKITDQENLNMSKAEYIQYLKDIISPLSYYFYKITVDKITIDEENYVALVSYQVEEYALTDTKQTDASNNKISDANFIAANCNMNLAIQSGDINILSSNCVEKIIRKRQ